MLVLALEWPDRRMPHAFVTRFPVVGILEPTGVFDPADGEPEPMPEAVLRASGQAARDKLRGRVRQEHEDFIGDSLKKEVAEGKAAAPMSEAEVTVHLGTMCGCAPLVGTS